MKISIKDIILFISLFTICKAGSDIGLIAYFETECPENWIEFTEGNNKVIRTKSYINNKIDYK